MIRRLGFWPLLFMLSIFALSLRLIGLDWDQGLYLHPDERFVVWVTTDLRWPASIGEYFNTATSPLNPYNTDHSSFVYGTLPSFLVKAIAALFGMDSYGQLHLIGRATNAVFDTGTVVLTAILARRFFDDRAGLISGLLLACTPLFLQSAHFFTVDTMAVFFTMAAFACAVRSWDRNSIGWMALAGLMVGLAGASKPNYLIAIAFLALPALELIRLRGWKSLFPRLRQQIYPAIPATLTGGFLAFWTFRFAQPYAFSGPQWWNISLNQQWLDDLAFWRAVQTGLVDMKPSIQWIERTPIVYILQNMVLWGMGIALGLMALVALVVATWRVVRSPIWPSWWWIGIVGWCILAIAMYGTGIAQNQRYLMHVYPFLIILVAGFLIELEGRVTRKWIANLLTFSVIAYTIIFGLAFNSLYVRPITRIEASEWIYENIPAGSMLSNEYWDDALPLPLPGEDRSAYIGMTLDLYADEAENNSKVVTLVGQLSQVDYIVLSSNRVIDSVVRQPERYPVAVRYYEMLLSGELGFEPVAHFHQGPELLGIEWDDRSAEESLIVYEHPEVRIFVKTDAYNAQFVHDELNAAWGYGGYHYIPGDPLPNQMLMSDFAIQAQNEHGSWSHQVGNGWVQDHPLIGWYLAMQIVGLAAWPLTRRAFRNLPDMGWMLAKAVGLLGISAISLALVSWFDFAFDRGTIVASVVLMAAIALAVGGRTWNNFLSGIRARWTFILAGELLFLGVFLAMALLRSRQAILPDHNLMQLTGVMRSVSLPPFDPWMSGGVLHTHWAGILPWAVIGNLLSLEPVVVANLAIVGIVSVIAGVTWSLISAVGRSWNAVLTCLVLVFGSSFTFAAGLVPMLIATSVDISTLAVVLIALVLLHSLMAYASNRWFRFALISLAGGALIVSAAWGLPIAIALIAIGLALDAYRYRGVFDSWWPIVRRFTLELAGIIAVALAFWYPAYAAHTATKRDLNIQGLWTTNVLRNEIGVTMLMIVLLVVGFGAISVIASLLDEGTPGIIVCGLVLGSLVVLLLLAWQFNSAILILLLVSLLGVIAGWHWQHHHELLWSVALILLSCLVLAAAQTRPFRPDPAGDSSASQLLPLVWMFLVIAIGIAFASVVHGLTRRTSQPAIFAASLVMIILLVPTFDHIRTSSLQRTSLSEPTVLAPDAEMQAARWLQQNATGTPVILTGDGPGSGSVGTISAITGFQTVLGSEDVQRNTRPGWSRMVEHRTLDIATIYTGMRDWPMVSPLITQYDIRYIVVGNEERSRFAGIDESFAIAEANGHLERAFEYDDLVIYRVVSTATPPED